MYLSHVILTFATNDQVKYRNSTGTSRRRTDTESSGRTTQSSICRNDKKPFGAIRLAKSWLAPCHLVAVTGKHAKDAMSQEKCPLNFHDSCLTTYPKIFCSDHLRSSSWIYFHGPISGDVNFVKYSTCHALWWQTSTTEWFSQTQTDGSTRYDKLFSIPIFII